MKQSKYNIIIVGSGISGLYAALKLNELNNNAGNILLITKSALGDSNSYYAQGGMVAVLKDNVNDSIESHVEDTLIAGAGLSEKNTIKFISENSDKVVKDLLKFGVKFDTDENGDFTLTKEAAHSVRRILHSGGDATGREIEIALMNAVKNNKNIEIWENTITTDLILQNGLCYGVKIFKNGGHEVVLSNIVILATGGLGQIYKYTTNPLCATGDGFALSYRAGAKLRDMEFVQFHPTALAFDDSKNQNRFLISEAIRGEGAKLCDKNRNEYMQKYDKRKELAPRDIVARANFTEIQKNNSNCVYLNATVIPHEKLLKRFPTISKKCQEHNIDITNDLIPVAPAAHYFMGGIETNLKGETSIKNLFAIGEVASTGLHGANRLASNSLLECVVCAYETAKYISNNIIYNKILAEIPKISIYKIDKTKIQTLKQQLKSTMWENVGIFRSEETLKQAEQNIEKIEQEFNIKNDYDDATAYDLRNMIITAKLIIQSALKRKETRGAHFRTDYPQTNKIPQHSFI